MHGHEGSPTRNVLKQETVLQAYRARPWNNCENIDKKIFEPNLSVILRVYAYLKHTVLKFNCL